MVHFNQLDASVANWLERPSDEFEVHKVMIGTGKDNALGPYGYGFSLAVFQECFDIVKEDVLQIFELHIYKKFEKSLNATFIALILKINGATEL